MAEIIFILAFLICSQELLVLSQQLLAYLYYLEFFLQSSRIKAFVNL